jgi:hypothetical protein
MYCHLSPVILGLEHREVRLAQVTVELCFYIVCSTSWFGQSDGED